MLVHAARWQTALYSAIRRCAGALPAQESRCHGMTEFWLFRAIQRLMPGYTPAIALPTSDALRNTDGGPGNRPGGPDRPSQMGPGGPGQPRGGGGGTGWISRLFL